MKDHFSMKHIIISCALAASLASSIVEAGPITYLDNEQRVAAFGDNVYRYVINPLDWNAALAAASTYSWNGQMGHLVTVTSQAENDFLYSAFVGPRFATPGANVEQATPWLALSDRETEGTWKWMAGPEAGSVTSFENWNFGEPNNLGDEDYAVLHWQDRGLGAGRWYDYGALGYGGQTFVVEFENALTPAPVPVPATLPLLASALAGFGVWRRRTSARH